MTVHILINTDVQERQFGMLHESVKYFLIMILTYFL